FFGGGTDQVHQHIAPACHCHDITRLDHGVPRGVHDLAATSNALDEHTLLGQQGLRLLHRLAYGLTPFPHAERAQPELVPSSAGSAWLLLAPVLLLVAPARGLEIDA